MSIDEKAFAILHAKAEIRELVELYARGTDRKDIALLRTLYTSDAIHIHGAHFNGSAADFLDGWGKAMEKGAGSAAHYICNHLISVDGDEGEGEVSGLAWHIIEESKGKFVEDIVGFRYFDSYRREGGFWRFAKRRTQIDFKVAHAIAAPASPSRAAAEDPSYSSLAFRLFARGGPR
jgi:hypothetical protein